MRDYISEFKKYGKVTNDRVLKVLKVAYRDNQEAMDLIKYIEEKKSFYKNNEDDNYIIKDIAEKKGLIDALKATMTMDFM